MSVSRSVLEIKIELGWRINALAFSKNALALSGDRVHRKEKKNKEEKRKRHSFVVWLYTPPISDFILYYPCLPIRYSIYSGEETAVWISIERERERD